MEDVDPYSWMGKTQTEWSPGAPSFFAGITMGISAQRSRPKCSMKRVKPKPPQLDPILDFTSLLFWVDIS